MSRTDLRVLTYNVLSPEHGDWPRRRSLIQAGIAGLDPDVVLLQEDTGDVLKDYSRHGRNGKILGAKWVSVERK